MKAILFFVAAGIVREADRLAANKIAQTTGKRVVFRNGSSAEISGEKPENNEGVSGRVPSTYKAFPRYDEAGNLVDAGEAPQQPEEVKEAKLNGLGLPEGHPEDKDGLKAALASEGVEFHPNTGVNKLVALYKEQFKIEDPA